MVLSTRFIDKHLKVEFRKLEFLIELLTLTFNATLIKTPTAKNIHFRKSHVSDIRCLFKTIEHS